MEITRFEDGDLIKPFDRSTPCSFFNAIDEQASPGYCRCRTNNMVSKAGTFMNKCIYELPYVTRMFFLFSLALS